MMYSCESAEEPEDIKVNGETKDVSSEAMWNRMDAIYSR